MAEKRSKADNKNMEKREEQAQKQCPVCGSKENQINAGFNRSGTQRCLCKNCDKKYTLNPKSIAYPEEVREAAIKMYYSGISGRGVGKILGMNKSNAVNWIKKNGSAPE